MRGQESFAWWVALRLTCIELDCRLQLCCQLTVVAADDPCGCGASSHPHSHSFLSIVGEAALLSWHHCSFSRLVVIDTRAMGFAMRNHNAAES